MGPIWQAQLGGELGYAHWPQPGTQFIALLGTKFGRNLGKQDVCPNLALTAAKFVFSNSGNFRAKACKSAKAHILP